MDSLFLVFFGLLDFLGASVSSLVCAKAFHLRHPS